MEIGLCVCEAEIHSPRSLPCTCALYLYFLCTINIHGHACAEGLYMCDNTCKICIYVQEVMHVCVDGLSS